MHQKGFVCPICNRPHSLQISHSIELPPDRGDELTLQVVACDACGFRGAAVYEESRQGGGELWHHYCFAAPAEALDALAALIESCPARSERRCPCEAHATIGRHDASGRWAPPVPLNVSQTFTLRIAP